MSSSSNSSSNNNNIKTSGKKRSGETQQKEEQHQPPKAEEQKKEKRRRTMDLDARLALFDRKLCTDAANTYDQEDALGVVDAIDEDATCADAFDVDESMQLEVAEQRADEQYRQRRIDDDSIPHGSVPHDSMVQHESDRIRRVDADGVMSAAERAVWLRMFAAKFYLVRVEFQSRYSTLQLHCTRRTNGASFCLLFDRLTQTISTLHRPATREDEQPMNAQRVAIAYMHESDGDNEQRVVHACAAYVLADELRDRFVPSIASRISRRLIAPQHSSFTTPLCNAAAIVTCTAAAAAAAAAVEPVAEERQQTPNLARVATMDANNFLSAHIDLPPPPPPSSSSSSSSFSSPSLHPSVAKPFMTSETAPISSDTTVVAVETVQGEATAQGGATAHGEATREATGEATTTTTAVEDDDEDPDDKGLDEVDVYELFDPATAPLDQSSGQDDKELLMRWHAVYPEWRPMSPNAFRRTSHCTTTPRFTPPLVASNAESATPSFPRICAQTALVVQALRDGGEIGPARAIVRLFGDRIRVSNGGADAALGRKSGHGTRTVYLWAGHTFQRDSDESCVETLVHTTFAQMLLGFKTQITSLAAGWRNNADKDARMVGVVDVLVKLQQHVARFATVANIVKFIKYLPALAVAPRAWNANKYLVGVLNGVLEFHVDEREAAARTGGKKSKQQKKQQQKKQNDEQRKQQSLAAQLQQMHIDVNVSEYTIVRENSGDNSGDHQNNNNNSENNNSENSENNKQQKRPTRTCKMFFRPGQPSDCISHRSSVPWLGRLASSALFARFLHDALRKPQSNASNVDDEKYGQWDEPQIMIRDRQVERFVGRFIGSAMVAVRYDQLAMSGLGHTMNAKSVLQNALLGVLAPHAEPMCSDVLIETGGKKTAGAPDAHLVDVSGKRMLVVNETAENATLHAVNLKNLTGGDVIKVRCPHGDYVLVRSHARLLMFANHVLKVPAGENHEAIARRIITVWFAMKFVPDHKWVEAVHGPLQNVDAKTGRARGHVRHAIPNFESHLMNEAPGTLRFLARMCRDYLANGLGEMPESCRRMERKVQKDANSLQPFISASCDVGSVLSTDAAVQYKTVTSVKDLFEAYETWAHHDKLDSREMMTRTKFAQVLGAAFAKQHREDGAYYRGIRLKPDVAREQAECRKKQADAAAAAAAAYNNGARA